MADSNDPPELEVNIPIPEGLRVTTDEPYQILVVNDFAGSTDGTVTGPLQTGVVSVTANRLHDVMASANPTVTFKTTDPLASGNVMVEVSLSFDSIKAFDPKNLAGRLPATRSLCDIREKIVNRLLGKVSTDALSKTVTQTIASDSSLEWLGSALTWTPAESAADPDAVDSLLGQLDLGDEEIQPVDVPEPKTPIGAAVTAAADEGRSIPPEEASAVRRALVEVDRRISVWITTVLHAPQVQSLEAAWRSLAFLVSQMDFRKGLRLSILHAHGEEMTGRLTSLLIDPVFDEGANAPHVILVDRQFGSTAPDLETLDELAQHGASLPAVVLAGVSPLFFGVKHTFQIATLPAIANMFDQWQFAKWKTLRGQPYARSLGVVFGRCLMRTPYQRDGKDDLAFSYKEPCITDRDLVWGSGPLAAGCTIARSVADLGWPTAMAGYVHGRVEGFSTAQGGKKGDKTFGPSDTMLAQAKIEELGVAGINATVGMPDHEDVLVWNGLTAARIQRADADALLEVSLPYQLFASRLSALLLALKRHLSGKSPEEIAPFVTKHVRDWLPFEGDATAEQVSVQVRPTQDKPAVLEMAVTVTPPESILPGAIPVVMGYRIG